MDDNHCAGFHRNVAFVIWGAETTRKGVADTRSVMLELGRPYKNGIGLVSVVPEDAQVPSTDVRTALAGMLRDVSGLVKCSALVQEGTGFRAAAVRGVVTGLTLLARQSFPHHVFGSVGEAAGWMTTTLLPPDESAVVGRDELVAALAEARKTFDAQRRPVK